MSEVHTAATIDTVNPKVKKGRARFATPESGFELVSEFVRSDQQAVLSITAKYLYVVLADYVGVSAKPPYKVWPSVQTLADRVGVSPRSIQRTMLELEKEGFVKRRKRPGDKGQNLSNEYYLNTPTLASPSPDISVTMDTDADVTMGTTPTSPEENNQETSKKKQDKTTPIVPLKGEDKACVPLTDPMCVAIAEVCQLDIVVNRRKIQKLAAELIERRYTPKHVHLVPREAETGDYYGPMTPNIIRRTIALTVGENERHEVFTS